jgi:HPt (histidine-containing phosphotransfer) domain-containing protein
MSADQVFNLDEALVRADHDPELFQTMAALFMEHGPKDLAEIKTALAAHDAEAVRRFAHRLKGAILQFGAPAALEAAKQMEHAGKRGDVAAAAGLCDELEIQLSRLVDALRQAVGKGLAV